MSRVVGEFDLGRLGSKFEIPPNAKSLNTQTLRRMSLERRRVQGLLEKTL